MFEIAPPLRTGPITPSSSGRAPSEATGGRVEWHRGPMTSRNRLGHDSFRSIPIVGAGLSDGVDAGGRDSVTYPISGTSVLAASTLDGVTPMTWSHLALLGGARGERRHRR